MSQLTSFERNKFENALPIQITLSARAFTGTNDDGTQKEKPFAMSVRLTTETGIDDDAIRFTFSVSQFIKADSRVKNANGSFAKSYVELFEPAKVYHFSNDFKLSVDNFSESLFPTDGYLVGIDGIKTKAELANYFETMLQSKDFSFVKYAEINEKKQLVSVYDPTILLLFKLLEHTELDVDSAVKQTDKGLVFEKIQYKPIPLETQLQCFLDAAKTAKTNYKLELLPGMTLHSLNHFATESQKQLVAASK